MKERGRQKLNKMEKETLKNKISRQRKKKQAQLIKHNTLNNKNK